ncbi:alpha-tocopherol transfer protein-like [Battus philenor]|uniref:alpha-tocopherol transfer protein-like n=1 Tax=Battus philenor TaxID=42288 RepID=UPI0035D0A70E
MFEELEEERNSELSQNVTKLLNVTADDRRYIFKHNNISPKGLQDIILSIEEWYEKQPHLPKGQLSRQMIVQHLILKAFKIEEVKDKIDNWMSAKHKMPEILMNRDPFSPTIDKYLRFGFYITMPKKTPLNHRLSFFRVKEPFEYDVLEVVKLCYMIVEYRILNDAAQGEQWIFDLANVTFHNSVQMTPTLLSKIVYYIRFCFGAKIKGLHFVNVPTFVAPIINILKKLMKPKVAKRIYLYQKFEELYELFPKNILPVEYGGYERSCDEITDDWVATLQSDAWRKYFAEQDKVISDESKRTHFLSSDDFFGCNGSFRKLEVD